MTNPQTPLTAQQPAGLKMELPCVYTTSALIISGVLDANSGPELDALFAKNMPFHGKHLLVISDDLEVLPGGQEHWHAAVEKYLPEMNLYYTDSHLAILVYFGEDKPGRPQPICFGYST